MLAKFISMVLMVWVCAIVSPAVAEISKVTVINKGVGGYATADGLKRFQRDVLDVEPDSLILYFGMNDANNPRRRVPPSDYFNNMQAMIDKAKAAGIKNIILVTINPVNQEALQKRVGDHPGKNDLNAYLLKYDTLVRELAVKNHLELVDLRALCNKYGGGRNVKHSLIRVDANGGHNDGVHLTPSGYQKFAELFIPVFKEKISPGDVIVCFGDSITYGAHVKGAGTIYGETYPAWLAVYLNRLVGASDRQRPPPPLEFTTIPKNGEMEYCSDQVRPDFWNVWNVENRQEGDFRIASKQGVSGDALKVINTNSKYPAYLLSLDTPEIDISRKYDFSFQYKGSGQVRPGILFYGRGNKLLGTFPKSAEENSWRTATDEWKTDSFTFEAPKDAIKMRASFRVTGTVLLDNVRFSINRTKKRVARPIPAAGLKNKYLSLQVRDPQEGGGIISIRNADGVEFINRLEDKSLWRVVMRRLPTKKYQANDYVKLSLDPEVSDGSTAIQKDDLDDQGNTMILNADQIQADCNIEKSNGRIKLSWNGIDVKNEKGVLDVFVEFQLAENDHAVRVRSGINNRSKKFTVFYLFAPRVAGIYPHDNDLAADRLVLPCYTGRLVYNPIANGILGERRRFQPNRSGHSMQFDAYYHNNQGLYLGCFDGNQNIKRYLYEVSDNGLLWSMGNVPDNMKQVPQNYTVPYDTVIRCFKGDWYDAARIYREWALEQTWCSEGPLLTRKNIPQWFKEVDEWILWNSKQNESYDVFDPVFFQPMQKQGVNLCVDFHKWGTHEFLSGARESPDRFPLPQKQIAFIERTHQVGARIFGYLQGVCWCTSSPSFKRENGWKHAVQSYSGQPIVWELKDHKSIIAFPGPKWEKTLGKTIVKMAQAGFDGAYLDSNNHAGTYLNFNPLYNKQSGGGNEYIKSNRTMMRNMKAAARKYHPEFCFTAESFWEGNIAELDGIKAVNTWHRYLKSGVCEQIPLASAVYHDHAILFGCWVGRHSLQEDGGIDYVVKNGMGLVQGFKPGWNQPANMLYFKNKELALKTSLLRYRAYAASRKFLLYGEMLRPPVILNPQERIHFRWWRAWSNNTYDTDVPVIQSSLWKAADGSVGLVLYNASVKPQDTRIELTADQLSGISGVRVKNILPEELNAEAAMQSGNVVIRCTVPAQSPVVVELK